MFNFNGTLYFELKANTYTQHGGVLHSNKGGTYLEVRDAVLMEALRTTHVVQGEISRKGRNYQIEPEFIPASMTSLGNQTIIVLKGDFAGRGVYSAAEGVNNIKAQNISLKNIQENYDLASTQNKSGVFGEKKTATGGTRFSNLQSFFEGKAGVKLEATTGSVNLINSILLSEGNASIKAEKLIAILNDIGTSSDYAKSSKIKGFSHVKQSVSQSSSEVLASQLFVKGCFTLAAKEEVRLRAVKGYIQGDMSIAALNIILEGAVAEQKTTIKNSSLGLSFFGSHSLESIMAGKNGKAALKQLLQEDSFIAAATQLSKAENTGEKITQSVQTLMEGWRLASLIAEACDRKGPDAKGNDVIGALTDRYGITTPIKDSEGKITGHEFNLKITLSLKHSTQTQSYSRNVPTVLNIGGDLHLVGDVIKLIDGTQITAENITIHAKKLLEIKAGKDTSQTSYQQHGQSVSFNVNATNATFVGGSADSAKAKSNGVYYQNALIKARNVQKILVDGKAHLQGAELSGREVLIKAAELILESLQDEYDESNRAQGISVGADGKPNGFNMSHGSSTSRKVNSPSSISAAERLEILVDYLHQHGSVLSSADKLKVKGLHQAEPLSWTFSDIKDYSETKSESFKANFQAGDTFPVSGGYNKAKEQTEGYTRASVFQGDKNKEDKENPEGQKIPHGINTNREKAQETTSKSKSSMGIPLVYVNREKFAKDFENISKLFNAPQQEAPPAAEQENLSDRVRKLRELFGQAKDTKETDKKDAEAKNNQALEQALADKIAEQLRFKGLAVDEAEIQQTVKTPGTQSCAKVTLSCLSKY